ncbi:MAG: RraA family protein [Gammaproteobacteria bacterium]|nr:RraA family protein [Gammaproteobacteria bacterium]
MNLASTDLEILTQWDTPTICNALELVAPHRRGYGYTVKAFSCLYPTAKPMVGYARTARIRASSPDLDGKGMEDRIPYYEYVAGGSNPTIVVIEDLDAHAAFGAFWGEVHTAVHKGLGALGVITNGSYRDIADSAPGFQVLGGQVGPSHAFVHAVDFGGSVTVHGMVVEHDDVVHADLHGAVVIPAEYVKEIPAAVEEMNKREAGILAAARSPDFSIEKLKAVIRGDGDIH